MRTKRKRILCRNKLQDKYSRHLSRAGNTQFYICPSRNNINDRCIFGQDDKTKDDIGKNQTKIHIISYALELKFVPAELRHSSVLIG